jgi:DNA-binding NarL/FixJ family response regulator
VVDDGEVDNAAVAVVAVGEVGDEAVRTVRAIQRNGCPRIVLVAANLDEAGVLAGVEAGACAFLRRREASPERIASAITAAAAGQGDVPPDLLGRLLSQVSQLHGQVLAPQGIGLSGLADREVEVLRLVAEGHDTLEIAQMLSYSERTVKGVIHDVTTRLCLRNRSHAVAYAVRHGLI